MGEQYGGGRRRRFRAILASLNRQRGSAYDTGEDSPVYVENYAVARAIDAAWATNNRLVAELSPSRSTSLLSRWEQILGVRPLPTDTVSERRARLGQRLARVGQQATPQLIADALQSELGEVFVAVETLSPAFATAHWSETGEPDMWTSTVMHILVRTQKPASYTEAQFYDAVGRVAVLVEPILPAWATLDWYRPGSTSVAVGGVSGAGFYLSETEPNLGNQVFGE